MEFIISTPRLANYIHVVLSNAYHKLCPTERRALIMTGAIHHLQLH